ncbi:MAG: hypothetical protein K6C94_09025 [Candidatus Gastranaerophilales bacterium]|nr:hypothetical protein [Candidatus Gastranaerophilales bacterium]
MALGTLFTTIGTALLVSVATTALSYANKFIFGGVNKNNSSSKNSLDLSPAYQAVKQTQTNPDLPLPIIYGTVKTAGNLIWQNTQENFSQKVIAFSEGVITDITDIRINDIPLSSVTTSQVEKFYGTDTQAIPSVVPGNNRSEQTAVIGSLKNVACLGLTVFNDEKISSNYNLTAIIIGKKIRVYSSPNEYTVQYSENPAWVLFDFLTAYNGLGLALDENGEPDDDLIAEIFDLNSFIEAAAYCDKIVNNSPRFTFNMIFDSQTSVRSLLDEIYRSCRGGLFLQNGLLQFKIDKPEYVSKVFTVNDISNEVFNSVPSEEKYDILKCVYISPQHEWQRVEAFAEIPEYRNGTPVETSINILSCTNFEQASRLAWYYANCKVLQAYYGSFDTDYRAFDIEVGDVIQFDSILMGLQNYKVKVTKVTDNGCGLFTVNWQTYDERLYLDTLGSMEPRLIVTKLNDLYVYPPDVTNFNVVQSKNIFNFSWDKTDNLTYEIRQGTSWASAKKICSDLTDGFFSCDIDSTGFYTFLIKAKNKYNYSQNAASDVISVEFVPKQNIILQQKILDNDGLFFETYLYQNTLKLETNNLKWQNLNGVWNDAERENYTINNLWGANTVSSGYYISQAFDLGRSFQNTLSLDFKAVGNYEILFRYSDNEIELAQKDFITFAKGDYSFRYFQIKIILKAGTGEISNLADVVANIDVPDKVYSRSIEITNAQNGYLLNYADAEFFSTPGIVATVTDSIYAYASTADKTPTSAKIYAINNDGTKTTAKIDVQIFGY